MYVQQRKFKIHNSHKIWRQFRILDTDVLSRLTLTMIKEIEKFLADEKMYPEEKLTQVSNLRPNKSFLADINAQLHRFYCKNHRDRFMKDFFSTMYYGSWKEYFKPCDDHVVVFMMLVHLPERLIALVQDHDS